MKPYYEHAGITIYHGDCRQILPELSGIDLIVTDPPYGVNMLRGDSRIRERVVGDAQPFDPSHLLKYSCVLFGANAYASRLPDSTGWLIWDKYGPEYVPNSQCELAWTNVLRTVRIHREQFSGFMRDRDGVWHPTQKPVGLFRWILQLKGMPEGQVTDPYMGSGPVLVAAKNAGRDAIGIEMEEKYCEIAAKRLCQEVLNFDHA